MRALPGRQISSLPLPWRMFVLASLVVLLLVVSADGVVGQTTEFCTRRQNGWDSARLPPVRSALKMT